MSLVFDKSKGRCPDYAALARLIDTVSEMRDYGRVGRSLGVGTLYITSGIKNVAQFRYLLNWLINAGILQSSGGVDWADEVRPSSYALDVLIL